MTDSINSRRYSAEAHGFSRVEEARALRAATAAGGRAASPTETTNFAAEG